MSLPTPVEVSAAVTAGLALWFSLPSTRSLPQPSSTRWWSAWTPGAVGTLVVVVVGVLATLADGTSLALGLILAAVGAGTLQFGRRRTLRRAAAERADRVVELCESLAGELYAGQPPTTALRRSSEGWDELSPVVAAAELGGSVPASLRALAALPGAASLREVAGAWEVSADSGATMAHALTRVADGARRHRALHRVVASELASARATARLMAALPFGVLLVGSGAGGDPWGFLVRTPLGLTCLGTGAALALTGLWWIERVADAAAA